MKKKFIIIALVCLATAYVQAQQTRTAKKQPDAAMVQQNDHDFVMKALEGGNAEIMKGALAKTNSTSPQIMEYGKMMEQDHHFVNEKLRETARQKGYDVNDKLSPEAQQQFDKLKNLRGADFDREFAMQMISDHQKAIELFTKQSENGQDAELKKLASEALPKLLHHLTRIEQLQGTSDKR